MQKYISSLKMYFLRANLRHEFIYRTHRRRSVTGRLLHGLQRGDNDTIVVRPNEQTGAMAMCAVGASQRRVWSSGSLARWPRSRCIRTQ